MKTVGLIQARMGSLRLPGKVMKPLAGRPMVWHVLDRLRRVPQIDDVVLATTTAAENDALAQWALKEGIKVVRHHLEDDIAGRLAMAVEATGAERFVKINSDCPLADPAVIEAALELMDDNPGADGATNKLRPTYPLGLSVEILGAAAVNWCDRNLCASADRELMVSWIFNHRETFNILSVEKDGDDHRYNLCVDTPEDYGLMSEIFDELFIDGQCFGWDEVKNYLTARSSLPDCAYLEVAEAV